MVTAVATIISEAEEAGGIPTGDNITTVRFTCDGGGDGETDPPCSDGSVCLDGDLGVYCQCHVRASTTEVSFALSTPLDVEHIEAQKRDRKQGYLTSYVDPSTTKGAGARNSLTSFTVGHSYLTNQQERRGTAITQIPSGSYGCQFPSFI